MRPPGRWVSRSADGMDSADRLRTRPEPASGAGGPPSRAPTPGSRSGAHRGRLLRAQRRAKGLFRGRFHAAGLCRAAPIAPACTLAGTVRIPTSIRHKICCFDIHSARMRATDARQSPAPCNRLRQRAASYQPARQSPESDPPFRQRRRYAMAVPFSHPSSTSRAVNHDLVDFNSPNSSNS